MQTKPPSMKIQINIKRSISEISDFSKHEIETSDIAMSISILIMPATRKEIVVSIQEPDVGSVY